MNGKRLARQCAAIGAAGALCVTWVISAEPPDSKTDKATSGAAAASEKKSDDDQHRVSLPAARARAETMHKLYQATLDVMHHRYFHGDRAVVPARALEDVFSEIERQSKTEARWISVNMNAMSIDHEPKSKFEKKAAREIAAGKKSVEVVEEGYYRRAGAIPLTGGCVSCHGGFFKPAGDMPKFAGLVISVPIKTD